MSRSYNKVATVGFAVSNHKANSKYYKQKRKSARIYSKREFIKMINDALEDLNEFEHSINNYYYNRKERKLHRNTWDELTDGRYIWFKPKKNKNSVHGDCWRFGHDDYQTPQELYKIYRRK